MDAPKVSECLSHRISRRQSIKAGGLEATERNSLASLNEHSCTLGGKVAWAKLRQLTSPVAKIKYPSGFRS